jgi:Ni/Co efflux regulator RcnB
MMKLKSLIVAVLMLAVAGASMAQTAVPAKKHGHKKAHVVKKSHKVKHKKAAAVQ